MRSGLLCFNLTKAEQERNSVILKLLDTLNLWATIIPGCFSLDFLQDCGAFSWADEESIAY